jgi:hypothetical protein
MIYPDKEIEKDPVLIKEEPENSPRAPADRA